MASWEQTQYSADFDTGKFDKSKFDILNNLFVGDDEDIATLSDSFTAISNFKFIGSGTAINPYQVRDWNELTKCINKPFSYFKLMNDIDKNSDWYSVDAGSDANGGLGFRTIVLLFGGFDGNGKTINDLYVKRDGEDYQGVFGTVRGPVHDLGINASIFSDGDYVGALAGNLDSVGSVYNCKTTGKVEGATKVGGMIGFQDDVTSLVKNCYSSVAVSGGDDVGGLVGRFLEGSCINCYSTGKVEGTTRVGGLIGSIGIGVAEDCFWDTETSQIGSSVAGSGLTTAQMQDVDTFSGASWDIEEVNNWTNEVWVI